MRLQIGGSPCTHWSIARTKNRETEPSGIGWDLFENYLIALDKFKPDYFLYENNKSMSAAIRAEITKRFGFEPVCINSALVSAQNRQRLYWCGKRNQDGTYSKVEIEQPADRGILLRDILESGVVWREKGYTLRASHGPHGGESSIRKTIKEPGKFSFNGAAEPVSISWRGRGESSQFEARGDSKTARLTTGHQNRYISEPVRIGTIESEAKNADFDSQQYRVYSPDGKSVTLCGQGGGVGAKTGLYAVPWNVHEATKQGYATILPGECVDLAQPNSKTRWGRRMAEKSNCLTTSCAFYEYIGVACPVYSENGLTKTGEINQKEKIYPVYEVQNGLITINGKQYPIKLADGLYIIRKMTVTECKRLQTVPDSYVFPVSDTQAYKMLGNGWTVDVIVHLMSHFDSITTEPLDVLSMYDGMACGHIALDKLGANIRRYRATEIDKYAIKTACHNFPDIYQLGDAFQVRNEEFWTEVIG